MLTRIFVLFLVLTGAASAQTISNGEQVVSYSSSLTFNVGYLSGFVTLSGNVTAINVPAGRFGGQSFHLTICQGTGGPFTTPSSWANTTGVTTLASTGCTRFHLVWDDPAGTWVATTEGQGSTGPQGPAGPAGTTGAAGSNGAIGPQGPAGTAATPNTASSPLILSGSNISIPVATTSAAGYLASADWAAFNNKQAPLTLTTTGSSGSSTLSGGSLNIPSIPSSLPPSGTAGGDLSGGFPSPVVAQVNGAAVPASAALVGTNGSRQLVAVSIVPVGSGGTGAATLAAHGTVTAEGSGPLVAVAPGASGYVWTSNGSAADPTWQAAAGGGSSGINPGTAYSVPYYATTTTVSGVSGTGVPVFTTGAAPTFTAIGTAGAVIPLLSTANTWSSNTSFGSSIAGVTTSFFTAAGHAAIIGQDASTSTPIIYGTTGVELGSSTSNALLKITTTQVSASVPLIGTMLDSVVGTAIASAATISPVNGVVHVTGTTTINTITVPGGMSGAVGGCVNLIPDGLWVTGTSGNIAYGSTVSVGRVLTECYDGTKWYPTY